MESHADHVVTMATQEATSPAAPAPDTRGKYIDTLDVMIESVSESAPALVPLFRSDQQLRILGVLFTGSDDELSIGALAELADVAQATASREVARLAEHGLAVTRTLGRNRLVSANWSLPWAKELRSILTQTVGVLGRLADALSDVAGIDAAFVFGSWAARYEGEPGAPPRDVDVLVIGNTTLRTVRSACRTVAEDLRVEIEPIVMSWESWHTEQPDPFVAQIRARPLVEIPLRR